MLAWWSPERPRLKSEDDFVCLYWSPWLFLFSNTRRSNVLAILTNEEAFRINYQMSAYYQAHPGWWTWLMLHLMNH